MHSWRWLCGSLTVALVATATFGGNLKIAFDEKQVLVEGLTPGGQVVLFSVAREPAPFVSVMARREVILSGDGSGGATFDLDSGVPLCSIWVAVDLADGDFTVATPPGYPLRELNLPAGSLRNGPKGKLDRLFKESHLIEILVARPGGGAWAATVSDGSDEDEDGPANGTLTFGLERLERVGESPAAPDEFAAGDVLVAIDPEAMRVAAAHAVGPKP